jgi:hypothetical protein
MYPLQLYGSFKLRSSSGVSLSDVKNRSCCIRNACWNGLLENTSCFRVWLLPVTDIGSGMCAVATLKTYMVQPLPVLIVMMYISQ